MQTDDTFKSLADVFNRSRIFRIPFFQRFYVWEEDMWARFLDDILHLCENSAAYFFGVLITKQTGKNIGKDVGDERMLIDGQQRLTTFIIFFKVLSLLKDDKSIFDQFRLGRGQQPIALIHNRRNAPSFQRITQLEKIEHFSHKECKQDRILAVYEFFVRQLQRDDKNIKKPWDAINPWHILDNVQWAVVNLGENQNEQQIFDTINSLGMRLTTAELLKNFFFDENTENDYLKYWEPMFEKNDATIAYWDFEVGTGRSLRPLIEVFFYAYLQVKVRETNVDLGDRKKYFRPAELFLSYQNFIDKYDLERDEVVREICECAKIFREYFEPEVVKTELPQAFGIERVCGIIFGVGQLTLIPYVLFLLKKLQDDAKRNAMFQCIETYVMRRFITREPTKHYNDLFGDHLIAGGISTPNKFWTFVRESKSAEVSLPNDTQVRKGFHESHLADIQAKGVLYFIESKIRDGKKDSTGLLGIRGYSLEHLMPSSGAITGTKTNCRAKLRKTAMPLW